MEYLTDKTPMGRFMENLYVTVGQIESNHRSSTAKEAMAKRVSEGYSVNRPPLGYKRTFDRGLFKPTSYGNALGWVLKTLAEGNVSLDTTILVLRMGLEANSGTKIPRSRMLKILCDPYYAGYLQYNGSLYQGKHEALISPSQHLAILKQIRKSGYKAAKTQVVE